MAKRMKAWKGWCVVEQDGRVLSGSAFSQKEWEAMRGDGDRRARVLVTEIVPTEKRGGKKAKKKAPKRKAVRK